MTRPPSAFRAAVALLTTTPGVVSDRILASHGVTYHTINNLRRRCKLSIERVRGLGYRLTRKS